MFEGLLDLYATFPLRKDDAPSSVRVYGLTGQVKVAIEVGFVSQYESSRKVEPCEGNIEQGYDVA